MLHFKDSHLYNSEYLAEWEIRPDTVQHTITLETLIDRGLLYWTPTNCRTAGDLRDDIERALSQGSESAHDIGFYLGFLVRKFGARGSTEEIAENIPCEIARPYSVHELKHMKDKYQAKNVFLE